MNNNHMETLRHKQTLARNLRMRLCILIIQRVYTMYLINPLQPALLCDHSTNVVRIRIEMLPRDLIDRLEASNIHQDVEVCQQTLHDMSHAELSFYGEPPDPKSTDEDELGPQGKRFEDVGCSTNAGVEHDVCLVTNSYDMSVPLYRNRRTQSTFYNVLQCIQRSDGAVDLSACMVGHDDTINAQLNGLSGITNALNTF